MSGRSLRSSIGSALDIQAQGVQVQVQGVVVAGLDTTTTSSPSLPTSPTSPTATTTVRVVSAHILRDPSTLDASAVTLLSTSSSTLADRNDHDLGDHNHNNHSNDSSMDNLAKKNGGDLKKNHKNNNDHREYQRRRRVDQRTRCCAYYFRLPFQWSSWCKLLYVVMAVPWTLLIVAEVRVV